MIKHIAYFVCVFAFFSVSILAGCMESPIVYKSCEERPVQYDYEVFGIQVKEGPYGPGKEHLTEAFEFFFATFADFYDVPEEQVRQRIMVLQSLEFHHETVLWMSLCGQLTSIGGTYYSKDKHIFVWWHSLQNCLGRTSLFHELIHRYEETEIDAGNREWHEDDWLNAVDIAKDTFSSLYCQPPIIFGEEEQEQCRRDLN